MAKQFVRFLSSLKLTVACLAVAMVLVFIGTLAQVDEGLYAAQERYFKSFFIYLEPASASWRIPVFPGGYLVGIVLLANLFAAHSQRFTLSKKKLGIFMIHAGLILLLVGQLFTDILSRESALDFEEGQTKNYSQDFRKNELVFVDTSAEDVDTVISVPESRLQEGATISDDTLPFSIKVHNYWINAEIAAREASGGIKTKATEGPAKDFFVLPMEPVTEMDRRDLPAAVIELLDGDQSLGTWLASAVLKPQKVQFKDKEYDLVMRFKRYYEPFSLTLLNASHDKYKGTELPKNFSSRVRIQNEETGEDREVLIYMNHPLRYGGLTFFQFQMAADEAKLQPGMIPSSTLQVVRNPTWLTPYLACIMVGAGLTLQFMMHLFGFLKKQRNKPNSKPSSKPKSKPQKPTDDAKLSQQDKAKNAPATAS